MPPSWSAPRRGAAGRRPSRRPERLQELAGRLRLDWGCDAAFHHRRPSVLHYDQSFSSHLVVEELLVPFTRKGLFGDSDSSSALGTLDIRFTEG